MLRLKLAAAAYCRFMPGIVFGLVQIIYTKYIVCGLTALMTADSDHSH